MKRGKKTNKISFELNSKSTRRLQITEFYAAKFYKTKIKPKVDEELKKMDEHQRYPLGVVKRKIKECWEAESEEVRSMIIEEFNCQAKESNNDMPSGSNLVRSPQEYAS